MELACGCTAAHYCDEALDLFGDHVSAFAAKDRAYGVFARSPDHLNRAKLITAQQRAGETWDAYQAHRQMDVNASLVVATARERNAIGAVA